MPSLVLQPGQNPRILIVRHAVLKRLPLPNKVCRPRRTFIMRVIDVLNQSLARVQHVSVRNMVEEQQQFIRGPLQWLIQLSYCWRILPNVTSSRRDRSIHADAFMVSPMPLSPAISLGGFDSRPIVASQNVRQRLRA